MNYFAFETSYEPNFGDQVVFLDYNLRLYAGEVIEDEKEGWAVRLSDGKIKFPYASDTFKQGSVVRRARAFLGPE